MCAPHCAKQDAMHWASTIINLLERGRSLFVILSWYYDVPCSIGSWLVAHVCRADGMISNEHNEQLILRPRRQLGIGTTPLRENKLREGGAAVQHSGNTHAVAVSHR